MQLITELGKFKIGDYWRTRSGMKVLIYAISPLITIWPIQACCEENGEKFNLLLREDGSVSGEGIKMPCDLIEPWVEPELQLEVGEFYELNNGMKAYCYYRHDDTVLQMALPDGEVFPYYAKGVHPFSTQLGLAGDLITDELDVKCKWKDKQGT